MPGSASDYLENKLLDHALGTTAFTKPASVTVALYTVAPSDSTAGTEVTGGSYARQAATFSAAASGATTNNTNIDFTNMPAATVVAVGILEVSTNNLLFWSTLATSRTTLAGDTVRINSGALSVSLD